MEMWRALAFSQPVVRRSLRVALVVGTLLILINHGDALLRGDLGAGRVARMMLTYLVPYGVSTFAAVQALLEARRDRK